jgi:hypothetical protein
MRNVPPRPGWLRMRRIAPLIPGLAAALLLWPLASLGEAEQEPVAPRPDPASLSEIALDIIGHGGAGGRPSKPETSSRVGEPSPVSAIGSMPDPVLPLAHIGHARAGVRVKTPPTLSPPSKALPSATAGYQSNSWRQAPSESGRSLSFSSGVLPPASGLDPEIEAEAQRLRAQGRQSVYGFLLLRVSLGAELEKKLERLGVKLLGPHVHHYKARLPIGSLEAVARVPEVEWVGLSSSEQKLSRELHELRRAQTPGSAAVATSGLPVAINLFDADATGSFRRQLEATGAAVGEYDPALQLYRAVATWPTLDRIIALDFVLFVELIRPTTTGHDQSTPLVDADLIRPGGASPMRFSGASSTLGILDTGFMLGEVAPVMHQDLDKYGCGANFTGDGTSVWNDQNGHGTHVLTTISGTGTANSRYRGVATGVGSTSANRIRGGKIWTSAGTGTQSWMEDGMDFMASASECDSPAPLVINVSGGAAGTGEIGTDSTSRKLDDKVWTDRQAYVVCSGNDADAASQTIWSPGVAKNALTVASVLDNGYLTVGDISATSSRGPTGDGRMKPNLVAPGVVVTSALAGTTSSYTNMAGCSMGTAHVSGMVATLMEHYPEFRNNPALLRAHMMSSAIAHDDVTGKSNVYGLGRASSYLEHWAELDANGWSTHWFWGTVSSETWQYGDIAVPPGAQRLVVVLTWDEPMASAGAARAVTYDVDLYVDVDADCAAGDCGEYGSISGIDNVEYVVINNPPAGTYRLKAYNYDAPGFPLPYGMSAIVIRGDPTPPITASLSVPPSVLVGSTFSLTATVSNLSYVASGVQLGLTSIPSGVTLLDVRTTREDGVDMSFLGVPDALTLGNIVAGRSRSATYTFRADTAGHKSFAARAWSENGGTVLRSAATDLVEPFDYTMANSGAIAVTQPGGAGSNTITAALVSGVTQPVSFAVSGLPSGAAASIGSCSPTCQRQLTITTTASTPPGTYPITVTGSPLGRTTTFDLIVPAFGFTLTNSGAINVSAPGGSGSTTITATLTSGATQSVSFSTSGLPAGATASFSPAACTPTCQSELTITTTGATPPGTYPLTVTGSPLGRTTVFNLVIGPVRDIRGDYVGGGSATTTGCLDPGDDGSGSWTGHVNVTTQDGVTFSGSGNRANGSGGTSTFTFSGTMSSTGPVGGTFTYTDYLDGGDVDASGHGTFTGTVNGNTLALALTGQDTAGDTCSFTGAFEGSRACDVWPGCDLTGGTTATNLGGAPGSEGRFFFDVEAPAIARADADRTLTVRSFGGAGSMNLYVQAGSPPTTDVFGCIAPLGGACIISNPAAARWYILVTGVTDFSGVTIIAVIGQSAPQLINISTRSHVQTGDDAMIGGFVMEGSTPEQVLIRARGPSMADLGVAGTMTNPVLQLFSGSTVIARNDDWQTTDPLCVPPALNCGTAADIVWTGLDPCQPFPGHPGAPPGCAQESALLVTLPAGAYTAMVCGFTPGEPYACTSAPAAGVGLVEVFAPLSPENIRMVNISTRARVGTGDNIMIGGLSIQGGPKMVLLRGRGPALAGAPFFVPGTLSNPVLRLFSGPDLIAENDDWQGPSTCTVACGTGADIVNTGLDPCRPNPGQSTPPPGCAQESALLVTLPPGGYTFQLSGAAGESGVGLVEAFAVEP